MPFLLTLLLLAAPYWEKSPADWTDLEISQLLSDSPWAQAVPVSASTSEKNLPSIQAYLATARPTQLAEEERARRIKVRAKATDDAYDAFAEEYRAWFDDYSKGNIILAIRVGNAKAYSDSQELSSLKKSALKIGRQKIPMVSYFPPQARDPYLRVAFPRIVKPGDKKVQFELYVPGVPGPFRLAEFPLEQMVVAGKLEL